MIIEPLIPIFCIIVLGFAVSRTPVSSRSVWEGLERLTYYLFFPALLISRLSVTRFEAPKLLDIGLSLGLALLVSTLLFIGLHRFIAERRESLGSVYQGGIRFSTYIGLACIEALYGGQWAGACSALPACLYPGSERVERDRSHRARS